ncbi:MAG: hypothetical protein NC086_00100 [Alistipes sp.]|nr:hypothetical protein [Alistipes sp.]
MLNQGKAVEQMAVIMKYRSGNCNVILHDDDIEDMEEQNRLLRHAWSVEVNADYGRYLEEQKKLKIPIDIS